MELAEQLLSNITGVKSPPEWQGDLITTYYIGDVKPGNMRYHTILSPFKELIG